MKPSRQSSSAPPSGSHRRHYRPVCIRIDMERPSGGVVIDGSIGAGPAALFHAKTTREHQSYVAACLTDIGASIDAGGFPPISSAKAG
jgi:hypothetical protein